MRGKPWSPEEHENFVQAWEDVPALAGESVRKHCDRIHERFTALCGGETSRSAQALYVHQSVSTFNFKFIVEFEETHGVGSWFELSRRGREEVFLGSDHLSYPYLPMDQTMFDRMKHIREHTTAAVADAGAASPPSRRTTRQTSNDAPIDIGARVNEWSNDELVLLVRAWRAETKDMQLRSGEHTKFTANRSRRIYERFITLCGGSTTRTLAAARTKRQDLAHSCDFILQFNAAQRGSGKPTWYHLTKLQRLAVLRNIDKPGHFTDIPESICARIARVLGKDNSAGPRNGRDSSADSTRATHDDVDSMQTKKQQKKMKKKAKLRAQQQQEDAPRSSPAKKQKRSASASELSPGHFVDAYQELLDVAAGLEVQSHRVAELVHVLLPASADSHDERLLTQRTPRLGDRRSLRPDANGDMTRRRSEAHLRDERASRRPTLPASPGFGELVLQLQNQGAGQGDAWSS